MFSGVNSDKSGSPRIKNFEFMGQFFYFLDAFTVTQQTKALKEIVSRVMGRMILVDHCYYFCGHSVALYG